MKPDESTRTYPTEFRQLLRLLHPVAETEPFHVEGRAVIRFVFVFCRAVIAYYGSWPDEQLEQMPVRVMEVDATATVPVIQLPIFSIPWMAAVRQSRLSHSVKNGVEFVVTYVKRIVMHVERIILVEIEGKLVIHPLSAKMSGRAFILKPEDIGKKARRLFLVTRGIIAWLSSMIMMILRVIQGSTFYERRQFPHVVIKACFPICL